MAESFLQNNFAERIGGNMFGKDTKIYKFEKIKRAKREAMAKNPGVEIIDMGVGEPDDMAFPSVVSKLCEEAAKWLLSILSLITMPTLVFLLFLSTAIIHPPFR